MIIGEGPFSRSLVHFDIRIDNGIQTFLAHIFLYVQSDECGEPSGWTTVKLGDKKVHIVPICISQKGLFLQDGELVSGPGSGRGAAL